MKVESDREYSVQELAAVLGIHIETVRRAIRSGRLPARRRAFRHGYIIRGADALAWVRQLEEM